MNLPSSTDPQAIQTFLLALIESSPSPQSVEELRNKTTWLPGANDGWKGIVTIDDIDKAEKTFCDRMGIDMKLRTLSDSRINDLLYCLVDADSNETIRSVVGEAFCRGQEIWRLQSILRQDAMIPQSRIVSQRLIPTVES